MLNKKHESDALAVSAKLDAMPYLGRTVEGKQEMKEGSKRKERCRKKKTKSVQ